MFNPGPFFAQLLGGNLRHIASKTLSFFQIIEFFGKFLEFFLIIRHFFGKFIGFFGENSTKIDSILGKFYKFVENPMNFWINSGFFYQNFLSFFLDIQSCLHSVEFLAKNWLEFFWRRPWVFWKRAKKRPELKLLLYWKCKYLWLSAGYLMYWGRDINK